jgi:hypothetical protein
MRTVILVLSALLMVGGIGCMAISEMVTPSTLDVGAVAYVVDAGVADVNEYAGYPNLAKSKRLVDDLDSAYEVNDLNLQHLMDTNNLNYSINRKVSIANRNDALEREEVIFGEGGLLSTGLALLGVGGFSGVIGLMRKRPSDYTKAEMEVALAEVKGTTAAELSVKDKQLVQLVKGVQSFMNTYDSNDEHVIALKSEMNKAQDGDTRVAVTEIKTNLS